MLTVIEQVLAHEPTAQDILKRIIVSDVSQQAFGPVFNLAAERSYSEDVLQRFRELHAQADARALRARHPLSEQRIRFSATWSSRRAAHWVDTGQPVYSPGNFYGLGPSQVGVAGSFSSSTSTTILEVQAFMVTLVDGTMFEREPGSDDDLEKYLSLSYF